MTVSFELSSDQDQDFFGGSPATPQRSSTRQVGRMLCHLREQLLQYLAPQDRHLTMPTGWVLQCLVANCPSHFFMQENLQEAIVQVTKYLCHLAENDNLKNFVQLDGVSLLFPNHHLFDEQDTLEFFMAIDEYLEKELR